MAPNPSVPQQDFLEKKIYFVRHGESEGNAGPVRQGGSSSLTEKGREQARYIGKRASKLPVQVIVSSTMTRAKETAEIIAGHSDLPIEYSDLLVERRRPSVQIGAAKDDPVAKAAEVAILANFAIPGYRHSDEENFEDQKQRALDALSYLANRPEEHMLVVTHGFFMRIVMAIVTLGPELTGKECEKFIRAFHMENTGLSIVGYDGPAKDWPWWVWVWNDHAHLG